MTKVLIIFTNYNFDKDEGTAHAIVTTQDGKINIHEFDFIYEYDEDSASDTEDIRNITEILKKHYGDIEVSVKRIHKFHNIDYNK